MLSKRGWIHGPLLCNVVVLLFVLTKYLGFFNFFWIKMFMFRFFLFIYKTKRSSDLLHLLCVWPLCGFYYWLTYINKLNSPSLCYYKLNTCQSMIEIIEMSHTKWVNKIWSRTKEKGSWEGFPIRFQWYIDAYGFKKLGFYKAQSINL